jgi:hypothetical protein
VVPVSSSPTGGLGMGTREGILPVSSVDSECLPKKAKRNVIRGSGGALATAVRSSVGSQPAEILTVYVAHFLCRLMELYPETQTFKILGTR